MDAELLLDHSGIEKLRAIHAIGGGTQNRLLMSIKATVSNQKIVLAGVEEQPRCRRPWQGGSRRLR